MAKLIIVPLLVRESEDTDWMVEKIRAALIDQDPDAMECVQNFLEVYNPTYIPYRWNDAQLIAYAATVQGWDETGDAGFHTFVEENPEVSSLNARSFAEGYLVWAQGPTWWDKASAQEFYRAFGK